MPKKIDWDFSCLSAEQLDRIGVDDEKTLYSFSIELFAGYRWGSCWSSKEQADTYYEQFFKAMKEVFGKEMPYNENSSYYEIDYKDCGVFAHPMEWSGFGTKETIDKLYQMLYKMDCVDKSSIHLIEQEPLYPLNKMDYEELIAYNYPQIKKWFAVYDLEHQRDTLRTREYEVGGAFIKDNRLIFRDDSDNVTGIFGNTGGWSSLDVDVQTITALYRAYEAEKLTDRRKPITLADLKIRNKTGELPRDNDGKETEEVEYDT